MSKGKFLKKKGLWRNTKFPNNSNNRRYSCDREDKYPWLKYSPSCDGYYCYACFCFARQDQSNHELVSKPFCDWENARGSERGTLNFHEKSSIHQNAMKMADEFLQVCHQKKSSITELMLQAYAQKIESNRGQLYCAFWM